jgi:plasmid stabilization system protein ParE
VNYWIHPDAELELGDAAVYYATHASRLIADAFLVEYERVRDLLIKNQQTGARTEHGMRLYHFDRFPYTVIYEENDRLGPQIYAVAHQRRRPGYWASRT